jgi:hypothetical protein
MALKIERTTGADQYDYMHRGGVDNVIAMYSDQYANTAFRYIVYIDYTDFYGASRQIVQRIQPNPYGRGVLNMRQILMESVWATIKISAGASYPWIFNRDALQTSDVAMGMAVTISVYEGWSVGGVFTEDPDSSGVERINVMAYQGYQNALEEPTFNTTAHASKGFQDADTTTFFDRLNWMIPDSLRSSTSIYMPCTITNFGHLTFNADNGDYCDFHTATNVRVKYSFFDIDGVLLSTDTSKQFQENAGHQAYVPSHPQSILTLLGTWDNATKFYTIQLEEAKPGNEPFSAVYTFVIEDEDCRHTNVQLTWIGRNGAWQFFNFIKRNEQSIELERTEFKREYGNYGTLGYDVEEGQVGAFNTNPLDDRGIVSREPKVTQFIEVNSDWITENEFIYLKHLVTSEHVRIINHLQQGVSEPLVMVDNSYTMRRERNSRKYNVTFRFKYSKSYAAIDYEVPVPNKGIISCLLYDTFTKLGGNTPFSVSTIGSTARVSVVAATGGYIRFSVNSSSGNTLIAGNTYKVTINKVGGTITPVLPAGVAWFGLGIQNQATSSGGTIGTFTEATLPVSQDVVCGSYGANFYLRLPSLSSAFTGYFDITIGEGEGC